MLKLVIFLDLTILLILFTFLFKKSLHILENIFIVLFFEFYFLNFYAILLSNTQVWDLSKAKELSIIFRTFEVLAMPLMVLVYLNILAGITHSKIKFLFFSLFIAILYSIENLLVHWRVITYIDWSRWHSILAITVLLFVSPLIQKGFKAIMKREEMRG